MTTPLVIVGAGGWGREVHEIASAIGPAAFDFLGFVDADPLHRGLVLEKGPLLGGDEVLATLPAGARYVIAIADATVRQRVDDLATACGLEPATLVHPLAALGRDRIDLGPGTIVAALANLTTNVRTGRHVHLHISSTVPHDVEVGDYATVAPGARIGGAVRIGAGAFVGAGAAIRQGLAIGEGATVGLGAVVVHDVAAGATVAGVPARPLADSR